MLCSLQIVSLIQSYAFDTRAKTPGFPGTVHGPFPKETKPTTTLFTESYNGPPWEGVDQNGFCKNSVILTCNMICKQNLFKELTTITFTGALTLITSQVCCAKEKERVRGGVR